MPGSINQSPIQSENMESVNISPPDSVKFADSIAGLNQSPIQSDSAKTEEFEKNFENSQKIQNSPIKRKRPLLQNTLGHPSKVACQIIVALAWP